MKQAKKKMIVMIIIIIVVQLLTYDLIIKYYELRDNDQQQASIEYNQAVKRISNYEKQ